MGPVELRRKELTHCPLRRVVQRALNLRTVRAALDEPLPAYELVSTSIYLRHQALRFVGNQIAAHFDIPKNVLVALNLASGSVRLPANPLAGSHTPKSIGVGYGFASLHMSPRQIPGLRQRAPGFPEHFTGAASSLRRAV
jgi:hypothetical protein